MSLRILMLGLILAFAQTVFAQKADQPTYKAGDYWQFSKTFSYAIAGEKQSQVTRRVVDANSDGTFKVQDVEKLSDQTEVVTDARVDSSFNYLDPRGLDFSLIENVFPLHVGRPDMKISRKVGGTVGLEQKVTLKVAAYETITVPAGQFDCFHLIVTRDISGKSFGEDRPVHKWYCPEIQQIAKAEGRVQQRQSYGPGTHYDYKMELTDSNYLKKK